MKIRIPFKTPGTVEDALIQFIQDEHRADVPEDLVESQEEAIQEQAAILEDFLKRYIKHGEFVVLEFDTETKTAQVIPLSEYYR